MIVESWIWLVLQGLILLVLAVQYLQFGRLGRSLEHWQVTSRERQRRAYWHAEENRELKRALQAEQVRVEQLRQQVGVLQGTDRNRDEHTSGAVICP